MPSTLRSRIPVIMPPGYALKGDTRATMTTPLPAPDPQAIAQALAERMWSVATSDDHEIAWYRSDAYRAADSELHGALMAAYGINDETVDRVRALLSEYGPDDALQGTTGRGVASYVEFALSADGDDYRYNF